MAINFPDSPSVNDTHTVGDRTWVWDGTVWSVVVGSIPTAITELTITNDLTVDTSTLHVDSTNDRVGLGTTSPGYKLEVDGTIAVTNNSTSLISNNSNTGREVLQLRGRTGTGNGAGINLYGDADATHPGKALFYSDGSARLAIDGDNVGIGTTSPSYKVDVEDSTEAILNLHDTGGTVGSNTNARIMFEAGGSNAGQIGFQNTSSGILGITNADGPLYFTTSSADDMLFRPSSSTAMTIKADGKIGVRTTAPQKDFEMLNGIISVRSSASGTTSVGTDKGIALVANGMNTTSKYTPGVLFGSYDSAFTTTTPKYNAGIFGVAAETYGNDSDTAMQIEFRTVGTNGGTGHGVTLNTGYRMTPTSLYPLQDNSCDLGGSASNLRWDDVYATNGTIQTSDERDKANVTDLTLGLAFVDSLRPVSYTWNDRSGYVGTREHMGFMAQDIATVLGDDAADLAVWIHTEATEETDEEGNTVTTVDRQGLRYNELMAPMVKAIQELSARVAALEAE